MLVPHFHAPPSLGSPELPVRTLVSPSAVPQAPTAGTWSQRRTGNRTWREDWAPVPLAGGPGGRRQVHTAAEARPGRQEERQAERAVRGVSVGQLTRHRRPILHPKATILHAPPSGARDILGPALCCLPSPASVGAPSSCQVSGGLCPSAPNLPYCQSASVPPHALLPKPVHPALPSSPRYPLPVSLPHLQMVPRWPLQVGPRLLSVATLPLLPEKGLRPSPHPCLTSRPPLAPCTAPALCTPSPGNFSLQN